MPAFASHFLLLEELSNELDKKTLFPFDKGVAGIGAQGPDIFIFHRLWPPFTIYKALNGTATKLHNCKAGELFDVFSDYLTFSTNKEVAKSYIYGFILHYALDRNCHPYVYAYQDAITAENKKIHPLAAHNVVEHAMDTYLLEKRAGIYPPSDFDPLATFSFDEAAHEEIAHLLSYVISHLFNQEIPESEIIRAITDTAKLQNTLSDRNGNATRIAHMIETPLGPLIGYFKLSASIKPKDLESARKYANIDNGIWVSPYDKSEHTESFEELFERAKDDARELIEGFEAVCAKEKTGYEVTGNISFLTGLEVKE